MKVLLLNIDSKLPNIALHKIALYHESKGDEVVWDMPMMLNSCDKVYASCIFVKNRWVCENYRGLRPDLIIGGTGYDLTVKLPPEIEEMKPKINVGFTTRGCIRNCSFCFVPKAEGKIRIVGDIYDLWDGDSKCLTLLDNNILAVPDHFKGICQQIKRENITVDFNQGLDIRLVTPEICDSLFSVKVLHSRRRFAFDFPGLAETIKSKVALMREYAPREMFFFYVLVGYNTTFEEDLFRLNLLRELNCRAYVMRHASTPKERRYTRLAEWANQIWTFAKYDFQTFCDEYVKDKGGKPL